MHDTKPKTQQNTTALFAIALALFAFAWTWLCGRRGFFPLDASVVLDGSWRIVCGQVPFAADERGFRAPYGLSAFTIGALWIEFFGTTFRAWLALSCTLACVSTFVTASTVGRMSDSVAATIVAGLGTALWFQAPFGLPFLEQTAFFFGLLGLASILRARANRRGYGAAAWAGICLVLATLAKQNTGVCVGVILALALLVHPTDDRRRMTLAFASGAFVAALGIAIWFVIYSSPAEYLDAALETPSGLLAERWKEPWKVLEWILTGKGNWVARGGFLLSLVLACCVWRRARREGCRAAVLVVVLVAAQQVFNAFTNNRPENGYAFAGWILGASAVLHAHRERRLERALFWTATIIVLTWGVWSGWSRRVHDPLRGSSFEHELEIEGWRELRWGSPTRVGGHDVTAESVEEVVRWLRDDGRDFFVFPEFTALYAMLGREAPQPLVLFHPKSSIRVTGSADGDTTLDARVVTALDRRDIKVVVDEIATWIDRDFILASLPRLRAWLGECREVVRFGTFRILVRPDTGSERGR